MTYPHEVCFGWTCSIYSTATETPSLQKLSCSWIEYSTCLFFFINLSYIPISYQQVIRSRLQEQGQVRNSEVHYAGVVDCIRKVFQKEGLPGFYRGCATNLLRTTPSAVITFTSYEMIHRFLDQVLPPDAKNSEAHPKPDGQVKSQPDTRGNMEENKQSQTHSNKITPSIPLGNK